MPCTRDDEDEFESDVTIARVPRSRYNEISAGAVLGLAARYALLMGLDRVAIAAFQDHTKAPSKEEVNWLRVSFNLLTCNFNLMLTSGFPASIDPSMSAQVARRFSSHSQAQNPGDLRVSGLVELVAIVHCAMRSCGDVSGRQLSSDNLRKLNIQFDEWER